MGECDGIVYHYSRPTQSSDGTETVSALTPYEDTHFPDRLEQENSFTLNGLLHGLSAKQKGALKPKICGLFKDYFDDTVDSSTEYQALYRALSQIDEVKVASFLSDSSNPKAWNRVTEEVARSLARLVHKSDFGSESLRDDTRSPWKPIDLTPLLKNPQLIDRWLKYGTSVYQDNAVKKTSVLVALSRAFFTGTLPISDRKQVEQLAFELVKRAVVFKIPVEDIKFFLEQAQMGSSHLRQLLYGNDPVTGKEQNYLAEYFKAFPEDSLKNGLIELAVRQGYSPALEKAWDLIQSANKDPWDHFGKKHSDNRFLFREGFDLPLGRIILLAAHDRDFSEGFRKELSRLLFTENSFYAGRIILSLVNVEGGVALIKHLDKQRQLDNPQGYVRSQFRGLTSLSNLNEYHLLRKRENNLPPQERTARRIDEVTKALLDLANYGGFLEIVDQLVEAVNSDWPIVSYVALQSLLSTHNITGDDALRVRVRRNFENQLNPDTVRLILARGVKGHQLHTEEFAEDPIKLAESLGWALTGIYNNIEVRNLYRSLLVGTEIDHLQLGNNMVATLGRLDNNNSYHGGLDPSPLQTLVKMVRSRHSADAAAWSQISNHAELEARSTTLSFGDEDSDPLLKSSRFEEYLKYLFEFTQESHHFVVDSALLLIEWANPTNDTPSPPHKSGIQNRLQTLRLDAIDRQFFDHHQVVKVLEELSLWGNRQALPLLLQHFQDDPVRVKWALEAYLRSDYVREHPRVIQFAEDVISKSGDKILMSPAYGVLEAALRYTRRGSWEAIGRIAVNQIGQQSRAADLLLGSQYEQPDFMLSEKNIARQRYDKALASYISKLSPDEIDSSSWLGRYSRKLEEFGYKDSVRAWEHLETSVNAFRESRRRNRNETSPSINPSSKGNPETTGVVVPPSQPLHQGALGLVGHIEKIIECDGKGSAAGTYAVADIGVTDIKVFEEAVIKFMTGQDGGISGLPGVVASSLASKKSGDMWWVRWMDRNFGFEKTTSIMVAVSYGKTLQGNDFMKITWSAANDSLPKIAYFQPNKGFLVVENRGDGRGKLFLKITEQALNLSHLPGQERERISHMIGYYQEEARVLISRDIDALFGSLGRLALQD